MEFDNIVYIKKCVLISNFVPRLLVAVHHSLCSSPFHHGKVLIGSVSFHILSSLIRLLMLGKIW